MKKLFCNLKSTAGFTLIELLVVIGILGILASALVATIDPFEQLNKAQDSNLKNASVEFLNGNIRYFTTHNAMPWFFIQNGGENCNNNNTTLSAVALSAFTPCINSLISEGELKQGFLTFSGLSKIFVTNPNPLTNGVNDVVVCYKPSSRSGQRDSSTKYDINGNNGSQCKSAGGNTDCYWCAQ